MLGSVQQSLMHLLAGSKVSLGHQTASTPIWARRHDCARCPQQSQRATRWFSGSRQQSGQIEIAWRCGGIKPIVSSSSNTSCSAAAGFHHSRLAASPAPSTRRLLRVLVRSVIGACIVSELGKLTSCSPCDLVSVLGACRQSLHEQVSCWCMQGGGDGRGAVGMCAPAQRQLSRKAGV